MSLRTLAAAAALGAGALLLAAPSSAMAQIMRFETSMSHGPRGDGRIGESDVQSLVETLSLDENQQALVEALYEGHRAAWDEAAKKRRESMQQMFQEGGKGEPRERVRKMRDLEKQWKETRDLLERDFLKSVRDVLTDDQLAAWPRFDRDRRRHQLQATQARLSGEGVDLIDVSKSIDLETEALGAIRPVADGYAQDLDAAISDRSRALESYEKATTPPKDGAPMDEEAIEKSQKRVHEAHIAVRDVNDRYAPRFAGLLSPDAAARFVAEFRERSFPRVYRPTAADRYIDEVRSIETLNTEQVAALDGIEADYGRQVDLINGRLAALIREEEEKQPESQMFFAGDGGGAEIANDEYASTITSKASEPAEVSLSFVVTTDDGSGGPAAVGGGGPVFFSAPEVDEEDDSPRGKADHSKRELIDRTIDAVAALLTPEQLALAPKPDELQRLAPEEQMQRMVHKALQNAVITTSGDGDAEITISVSPDSDEKEH